MLTIYSRFTHEIRHITLQPHICVFFPKWLLILKSSMSMNLGAYMGPINVLETFPNSNFYFLLFFGHYFLHFQKDSLVKKTCLVQVKQRKSDGKCLSVILYSLEEDSIWIVYNYYKQLVYWSFLVKSHVPLFRILLGLFITLPRRLKTRYYCS